MRVRGRSQAWLGLLVLLTQPLSARQAAPAKVAGFAVGGSLDAMSLLGEGNRPLATMTARLSGFNREGNGVEASLTVPAPGINRESGTIVFADLAFARAIDIGGPAVLLRGGGGFLIAGSGTPTVNAGLGLVVPMGSRLGFRADLTVRSLLLAFPHLNLLSVGIGLMVLP